MDEYFINCQLGQSAPDEEPIAKANNPWSVSLTIRPKPNCQLGNELFPSSNSASPAVLLSSSLPHLTSTDDSDASSDSDESLQTLPSIRHSRQRQLLSFASPYEDQTDEYGHSLCQIDGADDDKRILPVTRNPFLTGSVPDYVDIVSNRRLHRLHLDKGVFDFAYAPVPLPKGIISAVFNPSPSSYSLLRRSSDGYFSAMAMFKAAFPSATAEEVDLELEYVRYMPTTKPGVNDDNFWVEPAVALDLAKEYCLLPYVEALLDPADITIQKASADGSFQQITAPPNYPPTAVASPTPIPVSVAAPAVEIPGDGSPIGADGKPITRIFDPRSSLKHQAVPEHLLTILHPTDRVFHLQHINPATNTLEPDLGSLVIAIDGVVYTRADSHSQAGATVFFHHTCPWTTLAHLQQGHPQTRQQALLEGLSQALIMVEARAAADPLLRDVRIMTSSRELCLLFGLGVDRVGDDRAAAVAQWLGQTDMVFWMGVERRWRDVARGRRGAGGPGRPVDVRLWLVGEETIRPATEVAIAEMYRADGRDWYEENGMGRDALGPRGSSEDPAGSGGNISGNGNDRCGSDITSTVEDKARRFLDEMAFAPPQPIADQGPAAVARWMAATTAKYKQAMLFLEVASREHDTVASAACSDPGRGRRHMEHWGAHSRVIGLARARQAAVTHFSRFLAEHPVLCRAGDVEGGRGGDRAEMDLDEAGGDLARAVVGMVMADEELGLVEGEMEWE